jgi:hypothetical protein
MLASLVNDKEIYVKELLELFGTVYYEGRV